MSSVWRRASSTGFRLAQRRGLHFPVRSPRSGHVVVLHMVKGDPGGGHGVEGDATFWRPFLGATAAAVLLSLHGSPQAECELPFGQRAQGLAAEHYKANALQQKLGKPVHMQVRMHTTTPVGAKSDVRIVDIIDGEGIFHEIKTGSVRYTQATANQILKDAHILKHNPACQGYVWEFFPGKTGETKVDPKVLQELDQHGIKYVIHGHKPALDAAITCPYCSKENILKHVQDMAPKSSTDKVASAMSQATVLKVAGAVNLAVVLLSLGAAPVLRQHVDLLEQTLPELSEECSRFKASLDKMEVELDATLAEPKDQFDRRRQHHINAVVKAASRDFNDLCLRFSEIIRDRDAMQRQEQAENCAIISGCTVLMGLVLTVAVVECHCGSGVALGLSSAAAGGICAAGLESFHQCTRIIDQTSDELRLATSAEQDLNHKYMQLMEVLEKGMLASLSESVWKVHDWTHAERYITKISRQDALARLSRIGGGSVLGAKGQLVLIGRYDGGADISLCTITDIEGHGPVYEAAVQCSTSFSAFGERNVLRN